LKNIAVVVDLAADFEVNIVNLRTDWTVVVLIVVSVEFVVVVVSRFEIGLIDYLNLMIDLQIVAVVELFKN